MSELLKKNANNHLEKLAFKLFERNSKTTFWNLTPAELVEHSLRKKLGFLTDTGALSVDTGKFTGRAPKDRYIVYDDITKDSVWWGDINIKFLPEYFDKLYNKVIDYLSDKDIYVRDSYVCAEQKYRMNIRIINELPWSNLFAYNMFLRPTNKELQNFIPEWTIICAPEFQANPKTDGTRQSNFVIINFSKKILLIGGTGYTGEIKKGIFSVLNFILPHTKNVLSMHCSANMGEKGDTAIFFGLSGTGKTTLSSDPNRKLIGDDEHGWSENCIFNFEGGCYAKCINLEADKEPQIYNAIKFGALLENIRFFPGTRKVDFSNSEVTENTRVSYPIFYIDNIVKPSIGNIPENIFFLTADAFGVLPPISKLNISQAMYHFISGYTAKVAGTEEGITEPQTVFSACFGAPFLPLHPAVYAKMLGEKLKDTGAKVWLINTGWTGGPYGIGERIKLKYTRAMITAALNGDLDKTKYITHPIFGLKMPVSCPNVPSEILNPRNTWENKENYDLKAYELAEKFINNFEKFSDYVNNDILSGGPKLKIKA